MIGSDSELASKIVELENLERNAASHMFDINYQMRIAALRVDIQAYVQERDARRALQEERERIKKLEEEAKKKADEDNKDKTKKETKDEPQTKSKKEQIADLKREINELMQRSFTLDAMALIRRDMEVAEKREMLAQLEDQVFIDEVYSVDPVYYRIGEQVRVKVGDSYIGNPKEEFSVGEGVMPFVKLKDRKEARYHTFSRPPRKSPEIVSKEDFFISVELSRDPEAKTNGMAFGRHGTMYMHTGNTSALFYSPYWIVDPDIELGRKKYPRGAWRFINSDRSPVIYPKYNTPYKLQNKDGEYMYQMGEYIGGTRSYIDGSTIYLERIGSPQAPILPDKDFIAKAGDKAGKTCGSLPADASTADMAACAVGAVGEQTKEEAEKIPSMIAGVIPWWVYGVAGLVAFSTLKNFVR